MTPSTPPRRGSPRLRKVLKELHHQTWELELLVSGLVTFALIQVPGPLNELNRVLWIRSTQGASLVYLLSTTYLKLALYTLLIAFVLHLVVRAFWVGLVGLDSVFPRGVQLGKIEAGPAARELAGTWLPSVRQLMVRADELASVVFAAAFALAIVILAAVPAFGSLLLVGFGVASLLPGETETMNVFWIAWAMFMLFGVGGPGLDRFAGHRLAPEGWPYRTIRGLIRTVYRFTGFKAYGPVFYTLASGLSSRRVSGVVVAIMLSTGAFVFVSDLLYLRGGLAFPGSPWVITAPGPSFADPNFYEDERSSTRSRLGFPSIPSRVVNGPYLELFLPWRPRVFDEELGRACPDIAPAGRSTFRVVRSPQGDSVGQEALTRSEEILDCMGGLFQLELAGQPVSTRPVQSLDSSTGIYGLLYMIPMEDVPSGQYVLTLRGPVRLDGDGNPRPVDPEDEAPTREYQIVFWRAASG